MLSSSQSSRGHYRGALERALPSQTLRDVLEDKYQVLRRPKRVIFYCNGDRFFPGIFLRITPHRFLNFTDLLSDLTNKLPNHVHMPTGVRGIYTPLGSHRITDLEDLKDKGRYVCVGGEQFKAVQYGSFQGQLFSVNPHQHEHHLVHPSALYLRQTYPSGRPPAFLFPHSRYNRFWGGQGPRGHQHSGAGPEPVNIRPKVVTVVRHSNKKPHDSIKVLLNRNSIQSFPQLMADISGAFGPKWRNDKLRRLIGLDGREVQGAADLFRGNDMFVGAGNEEITPEHVRDLLDEFDPDNPDKEDLVKKWEKQKGGQGDKGKRRNSDSGYDESDASNENDNGPAYRRIPPPKYGQSPRRAGHHHGGPYEGSHGGNHGRNRGDGNQGGNHKGHHSGNPDGDQASPRRRRRDADSAGRRRKRPPWILGNNSHPKYGYYGQHIDPENLSLPQLRESQMRARELERLRAAQGDRERARRRMLQRLEAERVALDEARRKRGLPSLKEVYGTPRTNRQNPHKRPEEEEEERVKRKRDPERAQRRKEEEERLGREAAAKRRGEGGKEKAKGVVVVEEGRPKRTRRRRGEEGEEEEEGRGRRRKEGIRNGMENGGKNGSQDGEKNGSKDGDKDREKNGSKNGEKDGNGDGNKDGSKNGEKDENQEGENGDKDNDIEQAKMPFKKFSIASFVDKNHPSLLSTDHGPGDRPPRSSRSERPGAAPVAEEEEPKDNAFIRQVSSSREVADKYELGKTIGDGNFAVVKAAKEKATGKEVAIKVIDKAKLKGRNHMIVNEVGTMRQADHPNIVKLKEEYESPKEIFLVMELVKGGDLFDAITQSVKFGEAESASMVTDMLNALFFLHNRNIVHRDLKPENLLVMRQPGGGIVLKLADFGLAMEVTEPIFMVCGTPTYVAPEILEEKGYGIEVDLWAVGVIAYILLCGFPPFRSPDRNQTELFEFIKAGEFEFLAPYWNGISRTAKDFIQKLLIVNPQKRYSAIDALCHEWILTVGGSLKLDKPVAETQKDRRRELVIDADSAKHQAASTNEPG